MKAGVVIWVSVEAAAASLYAPQITSLPPESRLSLLPLKPTRAPRVIERQNAIPLNWCGFVGGQLGKIHYSFFV